MTRTHHRYPHYMEDQRRFFDELITQDWDTYVSAAWDRARKTEVDRLFAWVAPRRILDVGCGCGFHDQYMAQKPGVEEVVGIDYSVRSVQAAQSTYPHSKVTYEVGDLFDREPSDYDLVVSFQVIEHVPDPDAFLAACLRQVRPGGWVAAWTPNRMRLDNRARCLLRREPARLDPQHFREYTPAELARRAAAVGLTPVATLGGVASLTIPRLGHQLLGGAAGRWLGRVRPGVATTFCGVYVAGATGSGGGAR